MGNQRVTVNGIPAAIVMVRCIQVYEIQCARLECVGQNHCDGVRCIFHFYERNKKKNIQRPKSLVIFDVGGKSAASVKNMNNCLSHFTAKVGWHIQTTREISLCTKLNIFWYFIVSALVWRHEFDTALNKSIDEWVRARGPANKRHRNRELISRIGF